MASHTAPAPTETELALDAASLLIATGRLLVDHVCFKRIGVLLSVETELQRDDRLPRKNGFGGVTGCLRHVTEYGGPYAGMLRGIGPHAMIAIARKVRDVAAHQFMASHQALDPTQRSHSVVEVVRSLVAPLALTALCWPVKAVYNLVLGNYMTDVVSPVTTDVSVNPNERQERLCYRYTSVLDCWRVVSKRMGGFRNILRNGWEAYAVYRYLSYLLFQASAVVSAANANSNTAADVRVVATCHLVESLLREVISYPCNNIMMRMALLDTREGSDRVRGSRRYESTAECIREVCKHEGILGFYHGFRYHITIAGVILVVRYRMALMGKAKN